MSKSERAMPNAVITPDQDSVICEVEIAAPPEKIFQALTSSDLLMRWWNGGDGPFRAKVWEFDPRIGGRVRQVAYDPSGQIKINGISELEIQGEVTELDPPRTLAYTWRANFHSLPKHETLVRWELKPYAGGTQVKVTHSRLKPVAMAQGYADGWPGVMGELRKFAEGARA